MTPAPLRFITCGSVDDGKSTLIGRLLHDCGRVPEDQWQSLERDSLRLGSVPGGAPDFALLLDGLQAEREQGITIDCAYRYFSTPRRRFIVADAPGHEQYTRNMATGASTADAAVVLVDARKGIVVQTRRHARIIGLLGVRDVVLAVNKMDLVDWGQAAFDAVAAEFASLAGVLGIPRVASIPISALNGDNVARRSGACRWYTGPSLLEHLEGITGDACRADGAFRLPIQHVIRDGQDFRGYGGRIVGAPMRKGDRVRLAPSGVESSVRSIVVYQGEADRAEVGASVTLTLADEVDAGRGDVIADARSPVEVADQFEAHVIGMDERPLIPGRPYLLKIHTRTVGATLTSIKHRIDVDTGAFLAARELKKNDIAVAMLATDRPIPFDAYVRDRRLGAFILIDKATADTLGAGMIDFALRRSANVHRQPLAVDRRARAALKGQTARCLWLTGLSGAGKSTIANLLEARLHAAGRHTFVLDGDNVRHGLNRDLGFTEAARVENIRRVAEVARLMVDAGLIVIVAFISPFRAEREFARSLFDDGEFLEIHIDAPLEECERRDPKGLYAKARKGQIANFTGIDSAYEAPEAPELRLDTAALGADECVNRVMRALEP